MARLQCPNCSNLVDEVPGVTPVCPSCGFSGSPPPGGPAPTQPATPAPSPYSATPYGAPPGGYAPQPYPAPPGAPQPGVTVAKTNGFAVASLVLALVGICGITFTYGLASILAIVFGVIALNQCKTRGEQGAGMAIAGIVIGIVTFVIAILIFLFIFAMFGGGGPWWWWV